jgi:putative transposase
MAILRRSQARGVDLHYIAPGRLTQHALIESFNGKLSDELLNEMRSRSFTQTRAAASSGIEGSTPDDRVVCSAI